jgi:hypothetical protein
MKRLLQGLSLIIILFLSGVTLAGDITDVSVEKLMSLSGTNKTFTDLPKMIGQMLDQARQQQDIQIPEAEWQDRRKLIDKAFQPEEILRFIAMEIKNNLSESDAKDLLVWLESDLGRRFTEADQKTSTPEGMQAMMAESQTLLADKERAEIMTRLIDNTKGTDFVLELQRKTQLAALTAFSKSVDPNKPVDIEAFNEMMSAQQKQIRAYLEQMIIVERLYCYKDIDNESLEKLVEFEGRPESIKLSKAVRKGMLEGFTAANEKVANSLAEIVKKHGESYRKKLTPDNYEE